MLRRRLIPYVSEYGMRGSKFNCRAEIFENEWKEHDLPHHSRRKGKRVFKAVTGFAKYRIYEADENAMKLLAIG
ncbi:MAG: hypothetical protein QXX76_04780 [Archaeoglobaceae archaeon]